MCGGLGPGYNSNISTSCISYSTKGDFGSSWQPAASLLHGRVWRNGGGMVALSGGSVLAIGGGTTVTEVWNQVSDFCWGWSVIQAAAIDRTE